MRRRKVASTVKKHLARVAPASMRTVVPVIEEEIKVGKRTVESGRVRIVKHIEDRQQLIDQPLLKDEVQIKRVPVNKPISRVAPVRKQGDVLIIPVMEEVLVVEKRLILKEELHVRRIQTQTRRPRRIALRAERAEIKRQKSAEELSLGRHVHCDPPHLASSGRSMVAARHRII